MNVPLREVTVPFSRWAERVKRASDASTDELYRGSNPFSSTSCVESCCGLLDAFDRQKLGKECCKELLRDGVYRTLGEGTAAADWDSICRRLAQRIDPQAQHPAWLQQDAQKSFTERLRRASCSSEVAVLMLRLAVRAACLGSSWYGPWDSVEAVQQLISANAWPSLLHALRSLLAMFGAKLANQYNANNIVSDILHVSRALFSLIRRWLWSTVQPN